MALKTLFGTRIHKKQIASGQLGDARSVKNNSKITLKRKRANYMYKIQKNWGDSEQRVLTS